MSHDEFIEESKKLVASYQNDGTDTDEVYVVWSVKVLQNSKALLSTPVSNGMYYEATYNGDKNEIYFDAYKKEENQCVKYQ